MANAKIDLSTQYPPWNSAVSIKGGYWGKVQPPVIHQRDN
jgi:hypothetical protein